MTTAEVAVVGLGHSEVYRRDEVPLGRLVIDACTRAIADANLAVDDIDGIASNPQQPFNGATWRDGVSVVTPAFVTRALRLRNLSWGELTNGVTVLTDPFFAAVNAVAAGACTNALVFRGMHNPSASRYGHHPVESASGSEQFWLPYGLFPPGYAGLLWQAYMHRYGTSREDMAELVVTSRRNGLLWPHSYWRQHRPELLTREEYLATRMISWPVSLLDCDLPVQGAAAFVITRADRALDLRRNPAYVLATAQIPLKQVSMLAPLDDAEESTLRVGEALWRRSGLCPGDIDVANLYDGFTILTPLWLEGLGLCGRGEAFAFMTEERIRIGGAFPLNTSGGSQGAGRMHGVPHLMEGALQVMGESGPRQVEGARLSLASVGNPGLQSAVIFSRDRG